MSRSLKEPVIGAGKSLPGLFPNGSLRNFNDDDNLDLFSKTRRPFSVTSAHHPDVSLKLGRLSIGSAKQGKSGLDDLLSADGGKHDYDWLLTPPGTPLVPSSDGNESQHGLLARSSPLVRSISTTKASRLSVSQSESNHAAKPTRSRSVTRSSVSSSQHNTYSNKSTSILNSSSASVSSYIRPSTPTNRFTGTTRPSTPSARPSVSRSTTPSKSRTAPASSSSVDKPKPSQSSRPSTPTSRTQISTNTISSATWTTTRPSTPTRRNSAPSLSLVSVASVPGVHNHTNGRNVASVSRPSSPASRVRPPPQIITLPDFPLDTPPNLRTTLTERSISAGRSRPGLALAAAKGNVEPLATTITAPRRQPSPVVARGRAADPIARGRPLVNGQLSNSMDYRRDLSTRKPVITSTDGSGFGRTLSKKTPDTARHMDTKTSSNLSRPATGSNLFPQSIRSSNHKTQHGTASGNGCMSISRYSDIAENGIHINSSSESGSEEDKHPSSAKLANSDIYESSRYEMILLKEDLKNMSWLHSIDDKSDEGSIFDNGFERLPEPFDQE